VITAAQAAPGEVVDAASELFSVADLSRVYVAGQVYEKDLGRVQVGQPATILVAAYPDLRFPGRVASISALLDPQTRTIAVRVEVMNSGERLRLDMFASVELPTATKRNVLAVPTEAIQQVEGKATVFLRQDSTHFIARSIQLGTTVGGLTEVAGGLVAGETVVTKGAFQVKSALLSKELGEKE
jgi:cobalt-zinc-cadmium efflux system membrane fusion protein